MSGYSGRIWLDNVICGVDDEVLDDCRFSPWGINNCGHFDDVGVMCVPGELTNACITLLYS